jgi:diguanylate cyclase (GGDEF)-like protein
MDRLAEEFERSGRLNEPLSLILLDIDHFKPINDQYGHSFGDLVLQAVAALMKEAVRSYDIIGRIGGEEFLIIAPGSAAEESASLAERLLHMIRQDKIGDGNHQVTVTVSAGVTMMKQEDETPAMMLKRADTAMYRAKHEGRNKVVML